MGIELAGWQADLPGNRCWNDGFFIAG